MQSTYRYTTSTLIHRVLVIFGVLTLLVPGTGCKKYLTIPLPVNAIAGSDAFATDQTTAGVLNSAYYSLQLKGTLGGCGTGGSAIGGIGYNTGLYTDELQVLSTGSGTLKSFYANKIIGDNGGISWGQLYPMINIANTTIEAMNGSSLSLKDQWRGEALFLRALMYYYLVNLYGDVALSLTSDYTVNNNLSRIPQSDVYKQIVTDLQQAQGLLSANYLDYNGNVVADRARPNKAAATALLARIYLYQGDWADAETQAGTVIGNSAYVMETLDRVFLLQGKENIWGLLPTQGLGYVTPDPAAYLVTNGALPSASQVYSVLSPRLLGSFEANDARYTSWVGVSSVVTGTDTVKYYYSNKYKLKNQQSANVETFSILRLAEQYLIRAEARARQNKLMDAISDLNIVRNRAGLPPTTAATREEVLAAILQERRVELFTELGHRFFDLKRTGNIGAVMGVESPQKGSEWASYMQYWPIPTSETLRNTNLKQTPGYQQ